MTIDISEFLIELEYKIGEEVPPVPELKKRWKDLCKKHHPDKDGGDSNTFLKITHAYRMLTDIEYRDSFVKDEIRRGKKPNAMGDLNIKIIVPVSFDDGFFGRKVVVTYNIVEFDEHFVPLVKQHADVVTYVVDLPGGCIGTYERLVENGGHKMKGTTGNGLIIFSIQQHPHFKIEGQDVVTAEKVALDIMLKGGTIEVLTLFGLATVHVPAGSRPGDRMRIRKKGVGKRGNHFAVLEAIYPSRDDLKKDTWSKLGINWDAPPVDPEDEEAANYMTIANGIYNGSITFKFKS